MKKVLSIIIDVDDNTMVTEEVFKKELKKDFEDFDGSDEFTFWLNANYTIDEIFFLTEKEREELKEDYINDYINHLSIEGHDRFHYYKNILVNLED